MCGRREATYWWAQEEDSFVENCYQVMQNLADALGALSIWQWILVAILLAFGFVLANTLLDCVCANASLEAEDDSEITELAEEMEELYQDDKDLYIIFSDDATGQGPINDV